MAGQIPNLFCPIQIGNMTVRNRFVNTAHGTNFARDRMVTDRQFFNTWSGPSAGLDEHHGGYWRPSQ